MKNRSGLGAFLAVMAIAAIAPQGQALTVSRNEPEHPLALRTLSSKSGAQQFATFDEKPCTEVRAFRIAGSRTRHTGRGQGKISIGDDARNDRVDLPSYDPKSNQTFQAIKNIKKMQKDGQNTIINNRR